MTHPTFASDIRFQPYWWDEAPRPSLPKVHLPKAVDVAIMGSGYTGLSAALTLARAGREVMVFDAEDAGWGCSTRNGGQLGPTLHKSLKELTAKYGKPRAVAMFKEAQTAFEYVADLIEAERIECQFRRCGKFMGAHRPGRYEAMARELEVLRREVGFDADMVPRASQHNEVGTDAYYGGQVRHRNASLQPALYHQGLIDRVLSTGARIAAHTPVTAVAREGKGFALTTPRGSVTAREVIVATNGYTGEATRELRRRVIPIGSYIITTEPLAPEVMDRLMPRRRVVSDTRRVVFYYRPSPDGTRIVFGGRVAFSETDPRVSAPRLHHAMTRLFPELKGVKISHSWVGFVAYTFDTLPHIGVRDGIHHAMGYCGTGVPMAAYLGHKVALRVLGSPEGATAFDDLPFQTRPLYYGNPWFLAGALMYYRCLDRLAR